MWAEFSIYEHVLNAPEDIFIYKMSTNSLTNSTRYAHVYVYRQKWSKMVLCGAKWRAWSITHITIYRQIDSI
jgi:hypothetical protein